MLVEVFSWNLHVVHFSCEMIRCLLTDVLCESCRTAINYEQKSTRGCSHRRAPSMNLYIFLKFIFCYPTNFERTNFVEYYDLHEVVWCEVTDIHTEYRQQHTHQEEKRTLVDVLDTHEHEQRQHHQNARAVHPHVVKHGRALTGSQGCDITEQGNIRGDIDLPQEQNKQMVMNRNLIDFIS